jgi:predicted ATPase
LLECVNHFLRDSLRTRYRLECQHFARVASTGSPAGNSPDPRSARVAEDPPPAATQRARSADETITTLSIVEADTGLTVSHRDVGTGISQLLPVLVNAAGAKERLIAIEQPELHLHPALQAELGDVFIESALGENKNVFLIETHSEHLLLRIMRRMRNTAEGTLPEGAKPVTPNDVALLYVSPDPEGSVVQDIGLNERGELVKGWPGGFFEEGLEEMFS